MTPELPPDARPDEVCAYVERVHGISVRPIVPPPESTLADAGVPHAQEALALDAVLTRLPPRLLLALRDHGALTHILFLKTAHRTAFAAYNHGIIRLFPAALHFQTPDPMFGRLSVFEATVVHEVSEAIYRLYLDQEPRRLVGVRSLCTPALRALFEECYLWWLETGEPPGVTDEAEPHVLAAIVTAAVAHPPRVQHEPFQPLLKTLGIID